jgi:hypothetical protein
MRNNSPLRQHRPIFSAKYADSKSFLQFIIPFPCITLFISKLLLQYLAIQVEIFSQNSITLNSLSGGGFKILQDLPRLAHLLYPSHVNCQFKTHPCNSLHLFPDESDDLDGENWISWSVYSSPCGEEKRATIFRSFTPDQGCHVQKENTEISQNYLCTVCCNNLFTEKLFSRLTTAHR